MELVRTEISLPEDLIAEIDALAGEGGRGRYIAECLASAVRREKLRLALQSLLENPRPPGSHPDWEHVDSIDWVRSQRQAAIAAAD